MNKKDELIQFCSSYFEVDYLTKNVELMKKNISALSENDKNELAIWYARQSGPRLFMEFLQVSEIRVTRDYAIECMEGLVKRSEILIAQKWIYDALTKLIEHIKSTRTGFYEEVIIRCIKTQNIFVIQSIFKKNIVIDLLYTNSKGESIRRLTDQLEDIRLQDYLEFYFDNKQIKENCEDYFEGEYEEYRPIYKPKVNDYFETKAKSDCKELLKTYHKINLLKDDTSTEELRKFIVNDYNWDDGIAIPYFIIHHKNCDLALKKEIFELGAGDCLDRNIHSIYGKDPWERFIIELDDMIHESK